MTRTFIVQSGSPVEQRLEIGPRPLRFGPRDFGSLAKSEITVDQAFAGIMPGGNIGAFERGRVSGAFVAQGIEPGGADDRGRQSGMVPGTQWRNTPVGAIGLAGE